MNYCRRINKSCVIATKSIGLHLYCYAVLVITFVRLIKKTEKINLPQSVYVGHLAQCKNALKTTHDFPLELFTETAMKDNALFSMSHMQNIGLD